MPVDHETFPRQLFNHMHGVAVNRAVLAQPSVIHKIRHVDDHRVAFPMAYRVAVKRRIESRVMFPAVRRDHAKGVLFRRIDSVVEKDDLIGNLNDFGWRTNARKALWRALECWIFMALMRTQVFYFLQEFWFIRRQIGAFQTMLQFRNFIRWLNGTLLPALRVVGLSVRAIGSRADGVSPTGRRPKSGQVGMAIGQMRCRPFPRSL